MVGRQDRTPQRAHRASSVSVVLATFNGEEFLHQQLESLRAQERLPDELVVIDDASTDRTPALLRSFASSAPFHVEVVNRTRHLGTAETFAEAIRRSSGDVIMICDQDDRWHPEKVGRMERQLAANPDAMLAFSDSRLIDIQGTEIGSSRWKISGFGARDLRLMALDAFGQMSFRQIVSGCVTAFRSELTEALLPFPTGVHPGLPDMIYDRWVSLLAAAAAPVIAVPDRLVDYRIHPGQQIGIPALSARSVAPRSVLRMAQFLVSRAESDRRTNYLLDHIDVIRKRLALGGLSSDATDERLDLVERHLRTRSALPQDRSARVRPVIDEFRADFGYRRFSLGLSTAVADIVR